MAFDNGVAVPGGASYTAPLLDFTDIGKLPSVYRQAGFDAQQKEQNNQQQQLNAQRIADNQRQAEIAQTFKGGLPVDPATGAIDYKKAVAMLAQRGDTAALWNGADAMLSQSATNMSPMLTGGSQPSQGRPQGAPQGQPTSLPAKPLPPPAAGSPQGDPGTGTIASIVTDRLPGQDAVTGQTIAKIAQTMGIDPNATLTPGQLRRAQGLIQRYVPTTETPAGKPQAAADAGPGGQDTSFKDRFGGTDGGTLPPSANAVQPAPPAAAPPSADGGRSPAGQPQAGAPAQAPQPAPIGAPAAQPQAQPQQQPLRPQVPLPKGFSDPQAAILALRTEAARLSANPRA